MAKFMLVIVFLVFIIGGFYLIQGSIRRQLAFTLTRPGATSSAPAGYVYSPPKYQPKPYSAPAPTPTPTPTSATTSSINPYDIPQGYTLAQLSPYFHKIRIGSLYSGSSFSRGLTSLYASFYGDESINVTGWDIRARDGDQLVPRAVNIYDPSGLSAETDIVMRGGDTVNIYTSRSAIGENLRLNKCLGYLENYNHFDPPLPQSCPYIDRSEVRNFSGACQDYVTSLGGCRLPDPNPPIPQNDDACRYYLDTINYRGCFQKHFGDKDFLGNEWRVWSGNIFLDERHDHVLLLDRSGLIVDVRDY